MASSGIAPSTRPSQSAQSSRDGIMPLTTETGRGHHMKMRKSFILGTLFTLGCNQISFSINGPTDQQLKQEIEARCPEQDRCTCTCELVGKPQFHVEFHEELGTQLAHYKYKASLKVSNCRAGPYNFNAAFCARKNRSATTLIVSKEGDIGYYRKTNYAGSTIWERLSY